MTNKKGYMWVCCTGKTTDLDWTNRITPGKELALMLAKGEVSIGVYDAVAFEGIHFTLPQI